MISARLAFFMLPVLPHPLTAGSAHPFFLPASLGSCASSINAKLDSWSRHRSAKPAIAIPSPFHDSNSPEIRKLILRSSTMAHPMYGTQAASPIVYHQRYFKSLFHPVQISLLSPSSADSILMTVTKWSKVTIYTPWIRLRRRPSTPFRIHGIRPGPLWSSSSSGYSKPHDEPANGAALLPPGWTAPTITQDS